MAINQCRNFSREYDYGDTAVVRVANARLATLGGRRAWIKIQNNSNNRVIYRRAYGAGNCGLTNYQIELDYDSRFDLDLDGDFNNAKFIDCDLTIRRCYFFEKFIAHLKHPNLIYRIPFQIAVMSLVISIVSLIRH